MRAGLKTTALALAAASVLAACTGGQTTTAGQGATQGNQSGSQSGNQSGPSPSKSPVSTVGSKGRGAKSSSDDPDAIVNASLDDIEAFWEQNLPDTYGVDFKTLDKGRHPYDESTPPPSCGGHSFTYEQQKHNAYYCYLDDYIAWDRADLVPQTNAKFGKFAVALIIAHEWGHGISNRGKVPLQTKTIIKEQQADCFAGAWAKWQSDGNGQNIKVDRGDLQKGLAALLDLRDPPGGVDPSEQGAHGSAFDRINAFQEGFQQGGRRCTEYLENLNPLTEARFSDDEEAGSKGNAPYDDITGVAAQDLNDFYTSLAQQAGYEFKEIDTLKTYTAPPSCGDKQLTEDEAKNNVFFCPDDNYVGLDDQFGRNVYEAIGDFGVATLLAHQFAVALQEQNNVDSSNAEAQLQGSCFTGTWAFSVSPDSPREARFRLSPGDLDEAVQAFLAFSEAPDEQGQLDAFERVKAFRTGYFDGAAACTK